MQCIIPYTYNKYDPENGIYSFEYWTLNKCFQFKSHATFSAGDVVLIESIDSSSGIVTLRVTSSKTSDILLFCITSPVPLTEWYDYDFISSTIEIHSMLEVHKSGNKNYILLCSKKINTTDHIKIVSQHQDTIELIISAFAVT